MFEFKYVTVSPDATGYVYYVGDSDEKKGSGNLACCPTTNLKSGITWAHNDSISTNPLDLDAYLLVIEAARERFFAVSERSNGSKITLYNCCLSTKDLEEQWTALIGACGEEGEELSHSAAEKRFVTGHPEVGVVSAGDIGPRGDGYYFEDLYKDRVVVPGEIDLSETCVDSKRLSNFATELKKLKTICRFFGTNPSVVSVTPDAVRKVFSASVSKCGCEGMDCVEVGDECTVAVKISGESDSDYEFRIANVGGASVIAGYDWTVCRYQAAGYFKRCAHGSYDPPDPDSQDSSTHDTPDSPDSDSEHSHGSHTEDSTHEETVFEKSGSDLGRNGNYGSKGFFRLSTPPNVQKLCSGLKYKATLYWLVKTIYNKSNNEEEHVGYKVVKAGSVEFDEKSTVGKQIEYSISGLGDLCDTHWIENTSALYYTPWNMPSTATVTVDDGSICKAIGESRSYRVYLKCMIVDKMVVYDLDYRTSGKGLMAG